MPYMDATTYCRMMQMVKRPRPKTLERDQIGQLMLVEFGASHEATWRRHLQIMVMLHYLEPARAPGHYLVDWDRVDLDFRRVEGVQERTVAETDAGK